MCGVFPLYFFSSPAPNTNGVSWQLAGDDAGILNQS